MDRMVSRDEGGKELENEFDSAYQVEVEIEGDEVLAFLLFTLLEFHRDRYQFSQQLFDLCSSSLRVKI